MKNKKLTLLALFLSQLIFLWMFLAAAGFEKSVESSVLQDFNGNLKIGAKVLAFDLAAQWKHGMIAGFPLYMPGYFLISFATWFWASLRPLSRIFLEGFVCLLGALILAALLAPFGSAYLIELFGEKSGIILEGSLQSFSLIKMLQGVYTLFAFSVFLIAAQRALIYRSIIPLIFPLLFGFSLSLVRPPKNFKALWSTWWQKILEGEGVAIYSMLGIGAGAVFLIVFTLKIIK